MLRIYLRGESVTITTRTNARGDEQWVGDNWFAEPEDAEAAVDLLTRALRAAKVKFEVEG